MGQKYILRPPWGARSFPNLQACGGGGEKNALRQLQTSNDTCVSVKSKLRRMQDRAQELNVNV